MSNWQSTNKALNGTKRGGLGLTGGIADVGSLVDSIRGIHEGKASLKILEVYDEKRREIYRNFIDPVSTANLNRCRQEGSKALENDKILQFIKMASQDKAETSKLLHVSNDSQTPGYKDTFTDLSKAQDTLTADLTPFYDLENPLFRLSEDEHGMD